MIHDNTNCWQLAECATYPVQALPKRDDEPPDYTNYYIAAGVAACGAAAAGILWKRYGG
jgi:hypothetical protein